MPRLDALSKYWRDIPPLHIELARIGAAFGVPRPDTASVAASSTKSSEPASSDMMELFALFPMQS